MRLILDKKGFYGITQKFFGRVEERFKLHNALKNDRGSTILVSGDRGSGKTGFINQVASELEKEPAQAVLGKIRLPVPAFCFKSNVIINVPLIPSTTPPESLRGVILRSIIHAINVECWQLQNASRRPLLYLFRVWRLRRFTKYTSVFLKKGFGAGVSAANNKLKMDKVVESELDLSDIRIELELTSFFKKSSRLLNICVVFDELDKYTDINRPTKFIEELKNLFTNSGAHFIFVSTEEYFQTIQAEIATGSRDPIHTLYTHQILINQLQPNAIRSILGVNVTNYDDVKDTATFRQFENAVMWHSQLYPYELQKIIADLVGDDEKKDQLCITESTAKLYFSDIWTYTTSLNLYLMAVYEKYQQPRDSYFNRYLYKTLREVLEVLYNQVDITKINRANLLAIALIGHLDEPGESAQNFLLQDGHKLTKPMTISDTWRNKIYDLSHEDFESIKDAVEEMLWLMNRTQILVVTPGLVHSGPINLKLVMDTGHFSNIYEKLSDAYKQTEEEQRIISRSDKYALSVRHINNDVLGFPELTSVYDGASSKDNVRYKLDAYRYRFIEDLSKDAEQLDGIKKNIDKQFVQDLYDTLRPLSPAKVSELDLGDSHLAASNETGRAIVLVNPTDDDISRHLEDSRTRVFCIFFEHKDPSKRRKPHFRRKMYFIDKNLEGYQSALKDSRDRINKLLGL